MAQRTRRRWQSVLGWGLSLIFPVILILTSLRLLLTPLFLQVEYRLPGFPADRYGFTQQDRLQWAPLALEYLLNVEGIEFLGDLQFEDGTPLYNAAELRHMVDVKQLTQLALDVWLGLLLVALVLLLLLERLGGAGSVWLAVKRGAAFTLLLMAILAVGLAISFSFLFVGFHQLFFDAGTWTFRYSDTLIRLFPERFWRDAFGFVAVGTLAMAAGLYFLARSRLKRLTPPA